MFTLRRTLSVQCCLSSSYIPERLQPAGYVDAIAINYIRQHPGGPSDSDSDSSSSWLYSDSTENDGIEPPPKLTVFDARMMMRNMSIDESIGID